MKTILITGGAGFIGSHLCERLLQEGNQIICLDNLFSGKKQSIEHLLNHPNFEFVEHDIINPFEREIDEIYNLACPASPIHYQEDPIKTTNTCVMGTINMLELAKKYNAKILQASTSEVYGDPLCHPQKEDYWGNVNPIGIRSCYDEGKRCAETLFMDYYRQAHVRIKIIRIFNTYGPRMLPNDGRVVSNFIVSALNNKDLEIYGNGQQTRSFQYIDDLIEGMIRMMATPDNIIGPVNLGNPKEFTIAQLSDLVLQMIDSKSSVINKPMPNDDPQRRKPDISYAKEILNWEPSIQLADGLKKTIAFFKDSLPSNN